jgi:hypothetical protein
MGIVEFPKADEYTKALGGDKLLELYSKYPVYSDDFADLTREKQLENMVLNFGPVSCCLQFLTNFLNFSNILPLTVCFD